MAQANSAKLLRVDSDEVHQPGSRPDGSPDRPPPAAEAPGRPPSPTSRPGSRPEEHTHIPSAADLGGWELYEQLSEPRRATRILWFALAALAGALIAVALYLVS